MPEDYSQQIEPSDLELRLERFMLTIDWLLGVEPTENELCETFHVDTVIDPAGYELTISKAHLGEDDFRYQVSSCSPANGLGVREHLEYSWGSTSPLTYAYSHGARGQLAAAVVGSIDQSRSTELDTLDDDDALAGIVSRFSVYRSQTKDLGLPPSPKVAKETSLL